MYTRVPHTLALVSLQLIESLNKIIIISCCALYIRKYSNYCTIVKVS